jgi:hypothetical protein
LFQLTWRIASIVISVWLCSTMGHQVPGTSLCPSHMTPRKHLRPSSRYLGHI